jgi:predicted nucleotidyltransferase
MTVISIPSARHLDPGLSEVLRRIATACQNRGVPYLLTGAMAREILLVQVHGLPPGRATRDVDFGVLVDTWASFEALKAFLVATDDFVSDPGVQHRLYTVPGRLGLRMPVDIVPFGGVETPSGTVSWPPNGDVVMDVRGYEAAYHHAIQVEVRPGLIIPLPTPQGIAVMKILAWKDRGSATQGRDAIDLVEILERAEDIIGLDVLYDEHLNLVEAMGGDLRLAAAGVLGGMVRLMTDLKLSEELAGILGGGLQTTLVPQALRGRGTEPSASRYAAVEGIVKAFIGGLQGLP